ncbi:site-2 protease family protein [Candidatus Roizmanbacteria bacterium]|nr:site-2 protease family protein [Candidatus Roizmanbacteria bacterium]
MSIIVFILILGILVLVHELGHFIAAKKSGVLVEEFGFGFPPRIFGKKIGETTYSLNLFPIGGFVKLYGEEYHSVGNALKPFPNKNRTFVFKKPWQKGVIIISGVIGNFLLGWFIISLLFTQGIPTPINKVLIEKIQPGSPAAYSGLKEKDLIYQLKNDGKTYSISSPNDLIYLTGKFTAQKITLFVERGKKKTTVEITPRKNPPKDQGPLGIVINSPFVEKKYPWYQAPFYGLIEAFNITKKIVIELTKTLVQLITFQKPKVDVAGPIGIARYTGMALKFGKNAVLELVALLSLNLAVINIFPFPALDGGRLVFVVYEWITKKRINQALERNLNLIGFAILLSLAGLVTINDIIKIYR